MSVAEQVASAIIRMEGAGRSTRNNNPGNIWDGLSAGKTRRIWPNIPIDAQGFLQFPTYEAGYAELINQVQMKINRGMTLRQLINEWAPAKGEVVNGLDLSNDTPTYIRNAQSWTGLPVDTPLNQLSGGAAAPPGPTKAPRR